MEDLLKIDDPRWYSVYHCAIGAIDNPFDSKPSTKNEALTKKAKKERWRLEIFESIQAQHQLEEQLRQQNHEKKMNAWRLAIIIPGKSPNMVRLDENGNKIIMTKFENLREKYGWYIVNNKAIAY